MNEVMAVPPDEAPAAIQGRQPHFGWRQNLQGDCCRNGLAASS